SAVAGHCPDRRRGGRLARAQGQRPVGIAAFRRVGAGPGD
nr:hypothetical protein [Tanacetum cinerariifolium]